jgi:hypothetical protein
MPLRIIGKYLNTLGDKTRSALIFAVIFPFSPGFIWLELAITAVHPHDGISFSITSSSSPVFVKSKVCSIVSHWAIVPKS